VLEYALASAPDTWITAVGPVPSAVVNGSLGNVPIDDLPDGDLLIRLRVSASGGATFEDRIQVTVDRVEVTSPTPGQRFRASTIDVRGSVPPVDLVQYSLEWRTPDSPSWHAEGVSLTAGGTQRITNGLLATIDTTSLPQPTWFELRLIATMASDSTEK